MLSFEPNKPLIKLVLTLIVLAIVLCVFLSWRSEQNLVVEAVLNKMQYNDTYAVSISPARTSSEGRFYIATVLDGRGDMRWYLIKFNNRHDIIVDTMGRLK